MTSRTPAHRRFRFGGPRIRAALVGATMVGGLMALNSGTSFAVEFCNTAPISGTNSFGPLGLYPSPIIVSGLSGTVTDVNVRLLGLTTGADPDGFHWVEDSRRHGLRVRPAPPPSSCPTPAATTTTCSPG